MPAYKDKERGTWYCCFYYTDWQGEQQRKTKRGFAKQKDAKEWERAFLDKLQGTPQMTMESLISLYTADMSNRLRVSTMRNKEHMIRTKLLPYFGKMKIGDIKSTTVRQWQNQLIGEGFAQTYLKAINNQLCAIFNYAVKYYGLKENPCHKAGSIGRKKADTMEFWTQDEYFRFSAAIADRPHLHTAFQVLYWCGIREGELFALTKDDINFEEKTLTVSKSYQRLDGEDYITEPKTAKSKRVIALPDFLCDELKEYISHIYDDERIFPFSKHILKRGMERGCGKSGVKMIRVHDLRHSHASLLIELGFSPLLIAERLGHENIQTTLGTYSHLYPHKQGELAQMLDSMQKP